jgi:HD superfamily phosphohydrolase
MPAHDDFKVALEAWTENLVGPYADRLEADGVGKGAKEFNDPVWSTIVLRPLEVAILDSPLLQRLRMIRQLGLVHLVYPAANHTRLEHSIGVVAQIDQLVESINEHFANREAGGRAEESGRPVNEDMRNLLRLAALCHDVGHGAMSHVSENALSHYSEIREIREAFADAIESEEVPLSEIASYYIVGSAAFERLLKAAVCAVDERNLPPSREAIAMIQKLIIGAKVSDQIPLLHELMSGPFDADKLDYMTRDALMSGVPVVTDTARLVQKIRAVRVAAEKLPPNVGATVAKQDSYVMTGIGMSGARTLDELMFGRILLYDKLYRHHKVRAAEAMVASIFSQIAPIVEEGPALAPFRLLDHEVLELCRKDVSRLAGTSLKPRQRKAADVAADLAQRLKRRELFVRAFAFARGMPQDPYHAEPDHYDGLADLVGNGGDPEFRAELVSRIAAVLNEICTMLEPELVERYGGDFGPYLAVDPPMPAPDGIDAVHAYLISEGSGDNEIVPARPGIAGAARWSDAYLLTRETGYVFTTEELAPYAFLASEIVLRLDHSIRIPTTMYTYAKQDPATVEELKRKLDEKDYFKKLPSDLAPLPVQLQAANASDRVRDVLKRLNGYEGPRTSQQDKGPALLSEQRVLDWLKQFGASFGDEPLKLLEELRLIGREEVVEALAGFIAKHPEFSGASVCPLGTAKDSSAITTYYAGDLHDVTVRSLPEALASDDPIVFIDDFIGSGQQAVSILEAWLGEDPSTDLDEERGAPLHETIRNLLRRRSLGFVFASGQTDGVTCLAEALERLGLTGEVYLSNNEAPRAFGKAAPKARRQLGERCEEIGQQLLDDGNERHGAKWRERRALGYGNNAFLVTFPYNTPTQALTCLWKSGEVDGVEWTALLPRRPKV